MDGPAETKRIRAAVIGCSETGGSTHDDSNPMPRFSAGRERGMAATVVPLAPGVRAAALGRTVLNPQMAEWARTGLGEPQRVEGRLPGWVILALKHAGEERPKDPHEIPGPIDVPVFLEPATGRVVALDEPAIVAEAEAVRDLAMAIWRREEGWLRTPRVIAGAPRSGVRFAGRIVGGLREGVTDLVTDLRSTAPGPEAGARPDDASHEPVEGVDYRTWVTVRSGLERDRVHPTHVDLYTAHRGVPPGRWPAVDAAWSARAGSDARVEVWSEHDLRRLKTWGTL